MSQRLSLGRSPRGRKPRLARVQGKDPKLRDRTKPLVLGISMERPLWIALDWASAVGGTATGQLRHSPTLCDGMERARIGSIRRGYAYISGLRRFRAGRGPSTPHEERGLGNSYVQGTAALIFFDAGNRLRQLYRRHGARLIIPVHDAFVFEAPLDQVTQVAELTRSVLIQTVQEWFPDLRPSRHQHQVPGVLESRRAPRQRRGVRREPDAGIVIRARNERRGLRRGKEAANES